MKQCNNCSNRSCHQIHSEYPSYSVKKPEETGMRDTHPLTILWMQQNCKKAQPPISWGVPIIEQLMDKYGTEFSDKLVKSFRLNIVKRSKGQGYYTQKL